MSVTPDKRQRVRLHLQILVQSDTVANSAAPTFLHTRTMKAFCAFLAALAMAVSFWIPATIAVIMMAASIPMKNLQLAILGAILLLVALLLRMLIRRIAGNSDLQS